MQPVCRLCLGVIFVGKVAFDIDEANGLIQNVNNIREMLLFCAPELDIYISSPPVKICENCLPTLVTAYNFKVKCMNTENTIRSFVQKNKLKEGCSINLRSVIFQIGRLYHTGDATAGVMKHAIQDKKMTGINQRVLSLLRRPTEKSINTSDARNVTLIPSKSTPSRILPFARKRTTLPRQAKDQDLVVVASGVLDKSSPHTKAAPGSLRQDRRMAYLGLKRKSPEKAVAETSPTNRTSTNNNDESPNKVIVLDDDPVPVVAADDKVTPKIIITMNKDRGDNSVNDNQKRRSILEESLTGPQCKPGEKIIKKFNEVTITRKLSGDEVLLMNFEEEPEVCQIDSSDDEMDVEIIEPNHPYIDLVEDNTKKDNCSEQEMPKKQVASKQDDKPKNKENTECKEQTKNIQIDEEQLKNASETDTAPDIEGTNSLKTLKSRYQHMIDENSEIEQFFDKELVVKLEKMPRKDLKPTTFLVKIKKSKLFGCKYCSYGSLNRKQASDHFLYKHTLRGYYFCKYCEFKSRNLSDLGEHANTNHMASMVKYLQENSKDVLYACSLCNYNGGNILDLRHHRQKQHMKPLNNGTVMCPYTCPNYSTNSIKGMHQHIEALHETELRYMNAIFHCHICKYEVNSKPLLARHLKAHKKSQLLRCLLCPFSTKVQKKMDDHMKKHSLEEIQTSSGMVYLEGHAPKSSYNDDYRITLDSLRREAQQNYQTEPSSSSDLFGGPSLSEMLLVGLSENFDYVDLTDAQSQNSSADICENDNEIVEIVVDEEQDTSQHSNVEVEVPSSTSDNGLENVSETPKSGDKSYMAVDKESTLNENTKNVNKDSQNTASTKLNDEDYISTTTHCEEVSVETADEELESVKDKRNNTEDNLDEIHSTKEAVSDDLETVEDEKRNSEDNLDKIRITNAAVSDELEKVEYGKNISKTPDVLPNTTKKDDEFESVKIDNLVNELSVDITTKLNTSFSTFSDESNVSCGTSDLTKNVTELEDTIRELNSVLDGTMPTKILPSKVDTAVYSEVLNDIPKNIDSIEDRLVNTKEVDTDQNDDVCQDATTSKATEENVAESVEDIQETTNIISEITSKQASSKELTEDDGKSPKNVVSKISSLEDKRNALEKRCFLGADVKRISALEERFFRRQLSGGKSTENDK